MKSLLLFKSATLEVPKRFSGFPWRATMRWACLLMLAVWFSAAAALSAGDEPREPRQVSGIYPHLAAFNGNAECGIGAVVPWADRLWWITYPPHARRGSSDKLYSIDESMTLKIHDESVGGTHAARMIHRPSGQLFIGPYAIDVDGNVRAMDVKNVPGRYTAWAEHLQDPKNKLYLFDMEGPIWEVDVRSLAARRLFVKPAPGWHGKGAYTAGGRLVIANNGEASAARDLPEDWELPQDQWSRGPEDAGALAEYDGRTWNVVLRRQFVEVTGPGGIDGADTRQQPAWAMGWDRRSVLLLTLGGGRWSTFRVPKASHAMDPRHGWYTEWPRIRPIADDRALMCMHGMFYDFPLSFSAGDARGIRPLCSHLRYVPDFCTWNGRLVLAADDTSIMQNPMAGQSQSNLWFGDVDALARWGPGFAFGGPWLGDAVKRGQPSDPYLFAGFRGRMVHLAAGGSQPVEVTLQVDTQGDGRWRELQSLTIPASEYTYHVFADDAPGEWIRFVADRDVTISAYLHYQAAADRRPQQQDAQLFAGLRDHQQPGPEMLIRPAGHNRNLQILAVEDAAEDEFAYFEMDEHLQTERVDDDRRAAQALNVLRRSADVEHDAASAIVTGPRGRRYRLPRVPGVAPQGQTPQGQTPRGRAVREVQSERTLAHIGNIFYEVPRGAAGKHEIDFRRMRPVAAHRFAIDDFCTWRGLLALAGANPKAAGDGHVFPIPGTDGALWLGCVDDLWQLGKPIGVGGPWKRSAVRAGEPSEPYLMTGFDRKSLELQHDAAESVTFRIEVDYSNRDYWKPFAAVEVPAGETVTFRFPDGYSAHWARLTPSADCTATATFRYE